MAPFKPYTRVVAIDGLRRLPWGTLVGYTILYQVRRGVTQKPPYVDTPYEVDILQQIAGNENNFIRIDKSDSTYQLAVNAARQKLVSELGEGSQFGSTLTSERKASWGTVTGSITTALRAANAVRKGRLASAAQILGFHPPVVKSVKTKRRKGRKPVRITREHWVMPDGRRIAKRVGNGWLWYSYGIKPLVGDIYNGMDILTRNAPWTTVKASGKAVFTSQFAPGRFQTSSSRVRMRLDVRVANPNLWLANQMGLINPVQWINEGIPFSFVVDWFSNLSQIIMQMTDFVGLETAKPITTSKIQRDVSHGGNISRNLLIERSLIIPPAKLRFAYERFQWQRGANAISLLVGFLKDSKTR